MRFFLLSVTVLCLALRSDYAWALDPESRIRAVLEEAGIQAEYFQLKVGQRYMEITGSSVCLNTTEEFLREAIDDDEFEGFFETVSAYFEEAGYELVPHFQDFLCEQATPVPPACP